MTDYDTTEKVERTDRGFRLTVESTRGTGTRDQDKVKAELRTESLQSFDEYMAVHEAVSDVMEARRNDHPDEDGEDDG